MKTMQETKLEGLSEKIFLDRYAMKNADTSQTKVGDTVLVLTKDDPKFPAKEVGEVIERNGRQVKVKLRSGEVVDSSVEKLTLTLEKKRLSKCGTVWPLLWLLWKRLRRNKPNGPKSSGTFWTTGSLYPADGLPQAPMLAMS